MCKGTEAGWGTTRRTSSTGVQFRWSIELGWAQAMVRDCTIEGILYLYISMLTKVDEERTILTLLPHFTVKETEAQ